MPDSPLGSLNFIIIVIILCRMGYGVCDPLQRVKDLSSGSVSSIFLRFDVALYLHKCYQIGAGAPFTPSSLHPVTM